MTKLPIPITDYAITRDLINNLILFKKVYINGTAIFSGL